MPRVPFARRSAATGFDFTGHMRRVCEHATQTVDPLRHIDMSRVGVCFRQARKRVSHGIHASLTPMRFEGGSLFTTRGARRYTIERMFSAGGEEMLYILGFYLPRFLDCPVSEKLVTVFHELWHIGPRFDGDLRRHPGRCYVHSGSQAEYDRHAASLADQWLAAGPPEELLAPLRLDFHEHHHRRGGVYGVKIRHPKLLPV